MNALAAISPPGRLSRDAVHPRQPALQLVPGSTFHGRRGPVRNAFRYGVDYVLVDLDAAPRLPWLFSRNRRNLTALHEVDHGGTPEAGEGTLWVRKVLEQHGLEIAGHQILLMAQPRVLGHVFNPVSFWFCFDVQGALRVAIAEVNNTYGDRHSYLAHRDDLAPITPADTLEARKIFHVSPFQPVGGTYRFRFDLTPDQVRVWIDYAREGAKGGLVATLEGPRVPLSTGRVLRSLLRRPFGSRRVLALIHWQALKLWWKGATFRSRPEPPRNEVSRR